MTASPRPSAASLVVRVAGPLGAWQLEQARRRCGAASLVLSVEPGWPLPPGTFVVLGRFARVTLLVSEATPAVLGVVRRLRHVVDEVVLGEPVRPEAVAAVALAVPRVAVRVVDVAALGRPAAGTTPLGPPEPGSSRSSRSAMGAGVLLLRRVVRRVVRRMVREVRSMTAGRP